MEYFQIQRFNKNPTSELPQNKSTTKYQYPHDQHEHDTKKAVVTIKTEVNLIVMTNNSMLRRFHHL